MKKILAAAAAAGVIVTGGLTSPAEAASTIGFVNQTPHNIYVNGHKIAPYHSAFGLRRSGMTFRSNGKAHIKSFGESRPFSKCLSAHKTYNINVTGQGGPANELVAQPC